MALRGQRTPRLLGSGIIGGLFNHTGNLDVVEEIISPDYVSYEPTSGETRGIEGAKQFAATYREAFPDLTCTIEDMVAEGDKVVIRFRARGTHQGETEVLAPLLAGGWR